MRAARRVLAAACACAVLSGAGAPPPDDSSWYGRAAHPSSAWRSVRDFGAVGDGEHDDTLAIQSALNADRGVSGAKAPAVVYVPPGVYLVSDTLIIWGFTEFRGCSTSRPVLRLAPRAPGFGNASALRPLLASSSGFGVNVSRGAPPPPWWHNTLPSNFLFWQHVHSVDIDVSAPGNAGAVGLYWCVAQQTSVRAVSITVGGAFAGLDMCQLDGYAHEPGGGAGGGGSVEDVAVSGGAHSIRGTASQYAFRGLALVGARVSAVWLQDFVWVFAFVDVFVADTPAFLLTRALADRRSTSVSLIDAVLVNVSGPAALLLGGAGTPTFLQNVTLRGPALPGAIVANATPAGGVDAVWLPAQPPAVERWVGWADDGSGAVGNFVSGARVPASMAALPGSPRRPLASRARPWLDDLAAPPCNAMTDCGARGDNASDDTAALQQCVDRCAAVYLPFGRYVVSDTINLTAASTLVGEMLSNVVLAPHAPGFGDAAAPRPVLDTPDDADAVVRIMDVSLAAGAGNAGAVMLRWRAGPASGCWDVSVNISSRIHGGVQVVGAGAGYISNMHVWGSDHMWQTNSPMYDARATVGFLGAGAGPLTTYALISEHHAQAMVHITGAARDYDLVVTQSEQYQYPNASQANETVHILIDGGANNVAVYAGLTCNWWSPQVLRLVAVDGAGPNVSLFGLKGVGTTSCLVHQPASAPSFCQDGVRADPPFYGVPADVWVPQG